MGAAVMSEARAFQTSIDGAAVFRALATKSARIRRTHLGPSCVVALYGHITYGTLCLSEGRPVVDGGHPVVDRLVLVQPGVLEDDLVGKNSTSLSPVTFLTVSFFAMSYT